MNKFAFRLMLAGLLAVIASPVFAQSGDISSETSNAETLGTTIIKLLVFLAGLACVGVVIWGGVTIGTNRPKGLAMVGGGLFGALCAGLAFVLVSKLTGNTVTGIVLLPFLQ